METKIVTDSCSFAIERLNSTNKLARHILRMEAIMTDIHDQADAMNYSADASTNGDLNQAEKLCARFSKET